MLPVTGIGNEAEEKPAFTGQHSLAPLVERKIPPLTPPKELRRNPGNPKRRMGFSRVPCAELCGVVAWSGVGGRVV